MEVTEGIRGIACRRGSSGCVGGARQGRIGGGGAAGFGRGGGKEVGCGRRGPVGAMCTEGRMSRGVSRARAGRFGPVILVRWEVRGTEAVEEGTAQAEQMRTCGRHVGQE
jgi:hypothetical protein